MVHVFGFDHRNYAETFLEVTVFSSPCNMPLAWIADNFTSFQKWNEVQFVQRSKSFQKQGYSIVECDIPTPT